MYKVMEETRDNLVGLRITGKLDAQDYQALKPMMDQVVDEHGTIRMLIDLEGFEGWTLRGLLQDLKVDVEYNDVMEKIAIVGEKKLEELVSKASAPFFKGDLKWFEKNEIDAAWEWLKA